MLRRAALGFVLLLAPAAASCGAPFMRLPSGTSEPAPDAAGALAEATRDGRRCGNDWRVATTTKGDELYLRRESGSAPWRLVAIIRHAAADAVWRAEYRELLNDLPRAIHLISVDAGRPGAAFDLQLALTQIETNMTLSADVFTVRVPPSAVRMTLDELRQTGPLAAKTNARQD